MIGSLAENDTTHVWFDLSCIERIIQKSSSESSKDESVEPSVDLETLTQDDEFDACPFSLN